MPLNKDTKPRYKSGIAIGLNILTCLTKPSIVIDWPSTKPSIKRCTCVNKRKNSRSRWTLNNNITRAQMAWVSWRQDARMRASGRQRALGPHWPMVEQPNQYEKEALLDQYSSLSPSPAHLSHTTNINPFENKVWEIYFYKEVCSFVHWSSSWQLHKNVASNTEQILEATPHKAPTIRPPASHHENYPS